jgi:hypothetical protein
MKKNNLPNKNENKTTNFFDKHGNELFVGDEILLINWNENQPEEYKNEKRIIFIHEEDGFCIKDNQYNTGCWCSMDMINFDLCEKINKRTTGNGNHYHGIGGDFI